MANPGGGSSVSNAVLLERLEALRCDIQALAADQAAHLAADRVARDSYLVDSAAVVARVEAAHRRLDSVEPVVATLRDSVAALALSLASLNSKMSAVVGLLVFIGSVVGAWLVGRFLGLLS